MAGIKGQKSGGFGGRKTKTPGIKRSKTVTFKLTEKEKELLDNARGKQSIAEFILKLIKGEI